MKELHFIRTGKMHVATEGNYRFVITEHLVAGPYVKRWRAEVFERFTVRIAPIDEQECASKSEAIDWLARHRQPQDEKVRVG